MPPKTEFVLIRLTKTDHERLRRVAVGQFLGLSTWARQALLRAIEAAEGKGTEHPEASEEAPRVSTRKLQKRRPRAR